MNLWRYSGFSSMENIQKELETITQAYYDLLDDLKDHKEWVAKLEDDLGQQLAFTFLMFDETCREAMIKESEVFKRFDAEKAKYFR